MSEHHHHDHSHDHDHIFHTHAPADKMKTAFFLTFIILIAEGVGGIFSHSLALLSDAGHVLTDIAAIGLSWYALNQAQKPANKKMTFGYSRSGILAAFLNAMALILISIIILWEAYHRFLHPPEIHSTWMFVSAGVGLVINLYLGLGMQSIDDINVKSAVLHMIGDAVASAGVIIGGIVILFSGWYIVDPILSVLISLLIAYGAWKIVKQTIGILMESVPKNIDFHDVVDAIQSIDNVRDVHDLHIWSISDGKHALSCHVVVNGKMTVEESQHILRELEHRLLHLGIGHTTIQTEDAFHPHENTVLCCQDQVMEHKH